MIDERLFDEAGRLALLARYRVLDTAPEPGFDRITQRVRMLLAVPIAAVTLVARERQWFKSIEGLDLAGTPRRVAFCAHTILHREPLMVGDARLDVRFASNPLVTGEPYLVSYLGVPLASAEGFNLGALCAMDHVPRRFSFSQVQLLETLADEVVRELELRCAEAA